MATGYFVGANGRQRKRPATPVAELFAARHVVEPNGCWRWTGTIDRHGYGKLKVGGSPRLAHRVSYELHVGPIPRGKLVCHTCDHRDCVNPKHFFLGTHATNLRDRDEKQRQARGERHGVAKLTDAQAREIRALRAEYLAKNPSHSKWHNTASTSGTYRDLAARFGVSEATVQFVCRRKYWRHV